MNKITFIKRVELELLNTLCHYLIPFLDKKIKSNKGNSAKHDPNADSGLESVLNKPKISFDDFRHLESILLDKTKPSNLNRSIADNSEKISYDIELAGKKSLKSLQYFVSVNYSENSNQESLKITITKEDKNQSMEFIKNKKNNEKIIPYSVEINYSVDKEGEKIYLSYSLAKELYLENHLESKQDMSNRVPLKWLNILPENLMGGILGFTYLGENFMGRRADLTGDIARMVDIHESIHTPDEYETRVITSWILEKGKNNYKK